MGRGGGGGRREGGGGAQLTKSQFLGDGNWCLIIFLALSQFQL